MTHEVFLISQTERYRYAGCNRLGTAAVQMLRALEHKCEQPVCLVMQATLADIIEQFT